MLPNPNPPSHFKSEIKKSFILTSSLQETADCDNTAYYTTFKPIRRLFITLCFVCSKICLHIYLFTWYLHKFGYFIIIIYLFILDYYYLIFNLIINYYKLQPWKIYASVRKNNFISATWKKYKTELEESFADVSNLDRSNVQQLYDYLEQKLT